MGLLPTTPMMVRSAPREVLWREAEGVYLRYYFVNLVFCCFSTHDYHHYIRSLFKIKRARPLTSLFVFTSEWFCYYLSGVIGLWISKAIKIDVAKKEVARRCFHIISSMIVIFPAFVNQEKI